MDRFGQYTILRDLGAGGSALVALAQRDGSPDLCVLKRLNAAQRTRVTAQQRFKREAQVTSLLAHPNIARIVDAGFEDRTHYMAIEYIAGKTIKEVMDRLAENERILPPAVSISVALHALEGLVHAHGLADPNGTSLNLVHRDLSPANLMISFSGHVKIIDFGLVGGDIDFFKTEQGLLLGTFQYMSPEQARGEAMDRRSDIYSLAVTLHEMLTGRPVVEKAGVRAMLKSVVGDAPPPVHTLAPEVPEAVDAVLQIAMDKTPDARFASARAFQSALAKAAKDLAMLPRPAMTRFIDRLFPLEVRAAEDVIQLGVDRMIESSPERALHGDETIDGGAARSDEALADDATIDFDERVPPAVAALRHAMTTPPSARKRPTAADVESEGWQEGQNTGVFSQEAPVGDLWEGFDDPDLTTTRQRMPKPPPKRGNNNESS